MSWTAMKNMESVSKGMAAGENHGGTNFFYLHPVSCSGLTFCGGMIKIVN